MTAAAAYALAKSKLSQAFSALGFVIPPEVWAMLMAMAMQMLANCMKPTPTPTAAQIREHAANPPEDVLAVMILNLRQMGFGWIKSTRMASAMCKMVADSSDEEVAGYMVACSND